MRSFTDFVNNFLNLYPTLTKFQKKLFKYLQWFSNKFRCVFPCVQKMANAIGSSVCTVMRATALFQNLGWIYKRKRGYCSNLYFMNEELINLNLSDESLFLREKCEENDSVLRNPSSVFLDTSTQVREVAKNKEKNNRYIPEFLKIRGLEHCQMQDLANNFSECALYEAIQEAKLYRKKGNIFTNFGGYLWKAAKRYAKNIIK